MKKIFFSSNYTRECPLSRRLVERNAPRSTRFVRRQIYRPPPKTALAARRVANDVNPDFNCSC